MYYDIKEAKHIDRYKLEITFADGKQGIVDLEDYIKKGGVFKRFSDFNYFLKFYINKELFVLSWPDGLDIAPESVYDKISAYVESSI